MLPCSHAHSVYTCIYGHTIADTREPWQYYSHVHLHFFPRYRGDPFENGPINPRIVLTPVYKPAEFATFVAALSDTLSKTS